MNILFSPVSDTDPIAEKKGKFYTDGSLMHILRYYDIDKVYLYLSKEMYNYEMEDNRYTYCIEQMSKYKNKNIDCVIKERSQLDEVHKYDYFYKDFQSILTEIRKDIKDGDNIYLNVSSGTPAMKSALFVIHQLGDFKYTSIQVSTPFKQSNNPKPFKKEWWDYCRDNQPQKYYVKGHDDKWILNEQKEFENNEQTQEKTENLEEYKKNDNYIKENPKGRCSEEKSLNLLDIKYSEIIKELISKYEYYPAKVIIRDKMNINDNIKDKYIKI